jgi:CMP/dCMP kinase
MTTTDRSIVMRARLTLFFGQRRISSISIGGYVCSGKTTLATKLADKLGWQHVNAGQRVRELVQRAGLEIEKFGSLDDATLRSVDSEISNQMSSNSRRVWEGRLSPWLSKDFPGFLRVFCSADFRVRGQRYSKRESISIFEAEKLIHDREEEEKRVFERLYGIGDIVKSSNVDLVLDTELFRAAQLVEEILSRLNYRD